MLLGGLKLRARYGSIRLRQIAQRPPSRLRNGHSRRRNGGVRWGWKARPNGEDVTDWGSAGQSCRPGNGYGFGLQITHWARKCGRKSCRQCRQAIGLEPGYQIGIDVPMEVAVRLGCIAGYCCSDYCEGVRATGV